MRVLRAAPGWTTRTDALGVASPGAPARVCLHAPRPSPARERFAAVRPPRPAYSPQESASTDLPP